MSGAEDVSRGAGIACDAVVADVALLRGAFPTGGIGGLDGWDEAALKDLVTAAGRIRGWVGSVEAAALSALSRQCVDAAVVLTETQAVSGKAAKKRVKLADTLLRLPEVGEALAAGEISEEHVTMFAATPARLHDALSGEVDRLVADAASMPADRFGAHLRQSLWAHEADTGESQLDQQRVRRTGTDYVRAEDGMHVFHFELDPLRGARVRAALAKRAEQIWHQEKSLPAVQRRSPQHRLADAFVELAQTTSDGHGKGSPSGRNWKSDATIMIIADLQTLTDGLPGRCELVDGTPLPVDEVRQIALEAKLLPAIFDTNGEPLWCARDRRLPTHIQRLAVIARDRTCRVPNCCTPAAWTQTHHIVWWMLGGGTDIDNLVLVCSKHHHQIHNDAAHISLEPDGSIQWQPPPTRGP